MNIQELEDKHEEIWEEGGWDHASPREHTRLSVEFAISVLEELKNKLLLEYAFEWIIEEIDNNFVNISVEILEKLEMYKELSKFSF